MMTTRLMLSWQLLSKVLLSWQLLLAQHWWPRKGVTLMLLLHRQLLGYDLLSSVLVVGLVGEMAVGVTPAAAPCLGCVSISLMPLLPIIVTGLRTTWGVCCTIALELPCESCQNVIVVKMPRHD